MTDRIATIRAALMACQQLFLRTDSGHSGEFAMTVPALNALTALESELTPLRENALDLRTVPAERYISAYYSLADGTFCIALGSQEGNMPTIDGAGPTPSAALAAAIARIGK